MQMGCVLQCRWGCIAGFPFLQGLEARKRSDINGGRTAVPIGGVLQYFSDKLYGFGGPKQVTLQMTLKCANLWASISGDFRKALETTTAIKQRNLFLGTANL